MEGVVVAKSVEGLITVIGLPATIIILCVIGFFVILEVKKESKNSKASISELSSDVKQRFDNLQRYSDEKDKEILGRLEAAEKEIKFIERDYVTKTDHFKDTEGWRTEIQGVRRDVSNLPLEIIKIIKDITGKG
ncbi:MAG: hypothetical protein ACTTHG_03010 [Treponemataceae bacterium]